MSSHRVSPSAVWCIVIFSNGSPTKGVAQPVSYHLAFEDAAGYDVATGIDGVAIDLSVDAGKREVLTEKYVMSGLEADFSFFIWVNACLDDNASYEIVSATKKVNESSPELVISLFILKPIAGWTIQQEIIMDGV